MIKLKPIVKSYLMAEPKARERANKNRAIVNMLAERYPSITSIPDYRGYLTDVISEALTLDRIWRKLLETTPALRGSDYDDKDILEAETQIQLDYEPDQSKRLKAKVANPRT